MSLGSSDTALRPSPSGHYLIDAAGDPFFWLGDTAWPLFVHYSPREAEAYLTDRAERGFNVVLTTFALGVSDGKMVFVGETPSTNPEGVRPWDVTPAEPNEPYFDYAARIVDRARELGVQLAIAPTAGHLVTTKARAFDATTAQAYGEWLGRRFRDHPNIIWTLGADREPVGYEDVWTALARGLRAGGGGAHLLAYHPCGTRSSSQFWQGADWLDVHMIQTWTQWTKVYQMVAADYGQAPTRPVVLAEGAYEAGPEYPTGPITSLVVRRQAWWSFMAGGFHIYGHSQLWRMDPGWLEALDAPGARQMTVFREISTSRRWWELVPDQSVFTFGVGSGPTLNAAARAVDGTHGIVYLSDRTHVVLELNWILTRRVRATWVDPRNGERRAAGEFGTGNRVAGATFPASVPQAFTTPDFWEDAILLLDGLEET